MKLPQLPPEPIRREDEPGYEKEIWQPSWNCFCCQDTGKVQPNLVRLVIPEYDYDRDRIPVCQAPGCSAGTSYLHLEGCIDMRLRAAICQELDRIERENWRQTTLNKVALIQERIKQTAAAKSLRQHDRTHDEEIMAAERHQVALAEADKAVVANCGEEV
ncbi:hypothetical protein [Fischerella sp. PCC 9605]|uniref:hypothetical protein n=1 Tax=Fischerella sp. PCC 9605 TaxID=1173024 RepID=UPI0004BA57F6|nr:hypothetical protein [Fischerella sp. PCC 9605]